MKLYDEYAHEIKHHMEYEEKTVFPYVDDLLNNKVNNEYDIETFSKHHGQIDLKLRELKNIIIKYLPSDIQHNNRLTATLYDLYNNEEWLQTIRWWKTAYSYRPYATLNASLSRTT